MSECSSETPDIIKSTASSSTVNDLILQEPPKKKLKKESDDGTQYDSADQTTTNGDHKFNLVPDTEPTCYMSYLLSLAQDPPDMTPIEQVSELDANSPITSDSEEDTAKIMPTNHCKNKSPVNNTGITIDDSNLENTAKIIPTKRLALIEKSSIFVNNIGITIDDKNYVLDVQKAQDMLAALHATYRREKQAVVYARNEWGELILGRCSKSNTPQESQLQKCFQDWLAWNHKKYDHSRTPFCYKCYICNEAWWTLKDFRDHIVIHPNCFLEIEPVARECNIVAFVGDKPEHKEIRIYNYCIKCGRDYDYHVTHKYIYEKLYSCDYCNKDFVSCIAAARHMTICPNNHVALDDTKKVCKVCLAPFLTAKERLKHMLTTHSVRSDDLIVSFPRTCALCHGLYSLKKYHICWKLEYKHICQYCHRKFQCTVTLSKHVESTEEPASCPDCDITLRKCLLREHYIRYHCVNFLLVYQCPLCLDINIFLSLELAEDHMKLKHSGRRYSTIVISKAMLHEACLPRENIEQLPLEIEEEKSLSVFSEASDRSQGKQTERVKVDALTLLPFDKVKPEEHEVGTSKKSKKTTTKKEKDRSKLIEQLNEHVDLTPDVIGIKEEHISDNDTKSRKNSQSDDDVEIISDDDDRNSESVISKVVQERTNEVTKDSELGNSPAEIISDDDTDRYSQFIMSNVLQGSTTEVNYDSESGDDAEIITYAKYDDDYTDTFRDSESISQALQDPTKEKVTTDSESGDDTEVITFSKFDDDDTGAVGNSEPVVSKVLQGLDTEKVTKRTEFADNADIISDPKSVENDIDIFRDSETGISKVLQGPTTENVSNDSDEDVIESESPISKIVSIPTTAEKVKDDDDDVTDISKVPQDTTFAEVVKNPELLEAANLLKRESAALVKETDFLIVLDSTDSDEESLHVHKPIAVVKKELLKAGLKKRKTYRCTCGFTAYHRQYRVHVDSGCRKSKPRKQVRGGMTYKCTRCVIRFNSIRQYTKHLDKHGCDTMCPQCDTICNTNYILYSHILQHVKRQFVLRHVLSASEYHRKQYQCRTCDAVSGTKQDNFVHWEKHLRFKEEPTHSLVPFRAGVRAKQALKPAVLRELTALLQDKSSTKCCVCSKEPIKGPSGRGHLVNHLLEDAIANIEDSKLKCQICSDLHSHPDSYKAHMKEHSPLYNCKACHEVFNTTKDLAEHRPKHLRACVCKYCSRRFQHKKDLDHHVKSHDCRDRMQPTECPTCRKLFESKLLFDNHVQTAHETRCPICSMTFTTVKEMNDHQFDVHKEVMYAKCPLCYQIFRNLDNVRQLRQHVRSQHGRHMSLDNLRFELLTNVTSNTEENGNENTSDSEDETRDVMESRDEDSEDETRDVMESGDEDSEDETRDVMESRDEDSEDETRDVMESGDEDPEDETRDVMESRDEDSEDETRDVMESRDEDSEDETRDVMGSRDEDSEDETRDVMESGDEDSEDETRDVMESRDEGRMDESDRSDVLELESSEEECILLNDADLKVLS